jgi:hypothetical protein
VPEMFLLADAIAITLQNVTEGLVFEDLRILIIQNILRMQKSESLPKKNLKKINK